MSTDIIIYFVHHTKKLTEAGADRPASYTATASLLRGARCVSDRWSARIVDVKHGAGENGSKPSSAGALYNA